MIDIRKYKFENRFIRQRFAEEYAKQRPPVASLDFRLADADTDIRAIVPYDKANLVAVDVETGSLDPFENLLGVSLSCTETGGLYIPMGLPRYAPIIQQLADMLADPDVKLVAHGGTFDLSSLQGNVNTHRFKVEGLVADTYLAAVLLGEPPRQKGLKALSKKYLKEDMITFEDVVGEATFEHADMQQAYVYACDDARNTWRLAQILHKRLKDLNLYDYYSKIEVPFTYVIAEMQETGIEIDFEKWKRLAVAESKKIRQIKDSLNIEMKKVNATDLKLSSTKDLRELFFVRLNLKSAGKTPTGLDSTDHQALEKLSSQHSIPKKMIELREATKFYNAFIKSIPRLQKSYDKKLHPTFNHGLVLTGRLSCEDPNIQQWTTGIKAIAQPPDGYTFVGADYSQLELRVLAYMSQDPMLMEPFFLGESVHQSTADLMGVDYKTGKTLNFAVVYGAGAGRIVATAGVSWPMAKSLLKKFNNTYQRVDLFKKEVEDFVLAYGYTETMLGRRRWFPNIRQLRDKDLWKAQREAFNNIIQGTASSDIMKIAMLKLLDEFEGEDVRIFGQIHDEILLLCKESESANVQKRLEQTMINAIDFTPFNIPLEVESHVSKHWDKLK